MYSQVWVSFKCSLFRLLFLALCLSQIVYVMTIWHSTPHRDMYTRRYCSHYQCAYSASSFCVRVRFWLLSSRIEGIYTCFVDWFILSREQYVSLVAQMTHCINVFEIILLLYSGINKHKIVLRTNLKDINLNKEN